MISVVIPLYNKASTINRAVDSVLSQTLTDWELVVVNDGSSDEGPDLVSAYKDSRIKVIQQANSGVSAARNKGVKVATNTMVAFLDADDYWASTHLENLQKLITQFPQASLYGTAHFVVGGDSTEQKNRFRDSNVEPNLVLIEDYFSNVRQFGRQFFSSSVAVNKSWFETVGGFQIGVKSGEDIILWAQLACAGDVAYSKIATSYYKQPPVSIANRQDYLRRPQMPDYVAAEISKLRDSTPKFKVSLSRHLADWHRIRAMMFLELNEPLNSISELWKAARLDRLKFKDILCCLLLASPPTMRAYALAKIRRMRGRV